MLASCFSITTTPIHHSLSFVFLCLFSCPFPFPVSLSLCVLSGCGVWFVPRVCHTPPTHSLCLVLAAPPFLPLASTSLSVLSSSSSCCCGFVWVLLFVTPPLCFLACLWCGGVGATPSFFLSHQSLSFLSLSTLVLLLLLLVVVVWMSALLLPHTQPWLNTTPLTLWWLVCAHALACVCPHPPTNSHPHSFCPTPPTNSSSSCCCWCWCWWWWQRGCCGQCDHLVHSLAVLVLSTPITHRACEARGGGGCVWCGCHHHCAPFPPTTTTVCAAPPCPLCVCVGGGTGHSGALWWHARWCGAVLGAWPPHPPPTLSTLVASLLSPAPKPTPPTHTQMALLTPHTHGVLCVPRPIHSLTHWLPHCPHTLHTHWWVCVCSSTCSHAPSHTQRRHRRGACLAALVLWSPPPRPLCHTHTQGLVVGAMVVVGGGRVGTVWLPRHATHSPCLPPHTPHPPPHTMACCLFGTPCHSHHHHSTPSHTHHNSHCATMVVAIGHHAVHTHPTPATHHTHTKGKHRRGCGFWCGTTTTLVLAIRCLLFFPSCPPTPFSLSLACTHTPSSPHQQHHHPIHPLCGVCCGNGLMDGPHCG